MSVWQLAVHILTRSLYPSQNRISRFFPEKLFSLLGFVWPSWPFSEWSSVVIHAFWSPFSHIWCFPGDHCRGFLWGHLITLGYNGIQNYIYMKTLVTVIGEVVGQVLTDAGTAVWGPSSQLYHHLWIGLQDIVVKSFNILSCVNVW